MKSLNYLQLVNNDGNARKALHLLMCLPLLPAQNIETGFLLIRAFLRNRRINLERLFHYYER